MRTLVLASIALASAAAAGCGGSPPPPTAPPPPASAPASAAPAAAAPSPANGHTIPRSAVRAALSAGLAVFLRTIDLDDQPVLAGGAFHGFRVAALRGAPFWKGVDLKPGDVITGVNGFPIEHPEQAQTAFDSLQVASELRVSYERDGQPRELVYAIIDDR